MALLPMQCLWAEELMSGVDKKKLLKLVQSVPASIDVKCCEHKYSARQRDLEMSPSEL